MARTLRDAEIALLLESLPCVRAVHAFDPPTSEFDYIATLDRLGGAEIAEAHYRLVSGVGRERAARVWLALEYQGSAPRALERAVRVVLDASDRELAARSVAARREQLERERGLHFGQILAETIAWCHCSASASQRLRTPELRPAPLHEGRDPRLDRMSLDWWRLTDAGREAREREIRFTGSTADRMQRVAELAAHRARLLRERGLLPDAPSADAGGGRLLLWRSPRPRVTTPRSPAETARREVPDEFFDVFDCPPWDTWVSWELRVQGGEALVSWVPPEWRLRAEAAWSELARPGVEWLREPFLGIPSP